MVMLTIITVLCDVKYQCCLHCEIWVQTSVKTPKCLHPVERWTGQSGPIHTKRELAIWDNEWQFVHQFALNWKRMPGVNGSHP